jgi:hypothetical protein
MKRTILAIALVVASASPALGAVECVEGTIDWNRNPIWDTGDSYIETINTALVGDFLWVQPDDGAVDNELDGTVSVEVFADTVGAEVCADGKVTLRSAPAPDIGSALTMVDLVVVWGFQPVDDSLTGPK